MRSTLRESIIANQRFGVGYALGEAWDYLHLKVELCVLYETNCQYTAIVLDALLWGGVLQRLLPRERHTRG
jgi:hypothetical protein